MGLENEWCKNYHLLRKWWRSLSHYYKDTVAGMLYHFSLKPILFLCYNQELAHYSLWVKNIFIFSFGWKTQYFMTQEYIKFQVH